ncbi:MAG: hypothetical protein WCV84_00360 [Patescibacteria group bacterium]
MDLRDLVRSLFHGEVPESTAEYKLEPMNTLEGCATLLERSAAVLRVTVTTSWCGTKLIAKPGDKASEILTEYHRQARLRRT